MTIKNRGAFSNPAGRFEKERYEKIFPDLEMEEEILPALPTQLFPETAKSIISTNNSPDIGFRQSLNPYRGCEHGCIYCYARPSHSYVNLSPGLDFETKIFYKKNAAVILENEFNKRSYICDPIVLGANTDPYQPIEKKLQITRSLLDVFEKYQHPVIIITKSSMIERDIDILTRLAKNNLVKVAISITTLSNSLKLILEPRTSGPRARFRSLQKLSAATIPTMVMVAPIIPMINDMDFEKILIQSKESGAYAASYVLIRLPHEVKDLFKERLLEHFPDRASHVMSLIKQMRGGKEYDATFGSRMRGEGEYAKLLAARFKIACMKLNLNNSPNLVLNTQGFLKKFTHATQLNLF